MPHRSLPVALALLLFFAAASAHADGVLSTGGDCGGDAFSSAEVVERGRPRHGPLTAVPQTLCADLAPQRPAGNVDIQAYPLIAPENGGGGYAAPYGRRPR